MTRPESPPEGQYGKKLLIHVIDDLAQAQPERPFAKMPKGMTLDEGYRTVSMRDLATAVNQAAWWLKKQYPTNPPKILGYVGPQDLRYMVLALGGLKAGITMFYPSLRNSTEAHVSLLDGYQCSHFLVAAGPMFRNMMKAPFEQRRIEVVDAPELGYFFDVSAGDVEHFPWECSLENGVTKTMVAIQTSGSTGMPKPVALTLGNVTAAHALGSLQGADRTCITTFPGKALLNAFPFFHAAGFSVLSQAILHGYIVTVPPPMPLSAETVAHLVEVLDTKIAILPPSIIVDLVNEPKLKKCLSMVECIYYGGGPLPTNIGNQVTELTHLVTGWGSSEIGFFDIVYLDKEDWQWIKFPNVYGVEWRQFEGPLHEMVVVRDPKLKDFQGVFTTFPDIDEFPTKDLFVEHPRKPGLWKFQGRRDDIIVYSTGEKFNPTDMEDAVNGHPAVRSSLVCGTARFQSSLMIEPVNYPADDEAKAKLINDIWPTVEVANKNAAGHARIMKDMVIITTADKLFPRAGKGTVQRRMAVDMYQPELDDLYAALEESSNGHEEAITMSGSDEEALTLTLKQAAARLGMENVPVDRNLFDSGMDSLGVLTFVRAIRKVAPNLKLTRNVTAKDVYEAKTIQRLVAMITAPIEETRPAAEVMQELFEKYTGDLPITTRPAAAHGGKRTVLLTGSTGSLGSYLLDCLIRDSNVESIVCLNRTDDAPSRQSAGMEEKELSTDMSSVTFVKSDFSKPYFGLGLKDYKYLLTDVTHVIHNAWQVDFNVSLDQFVKTHIYGVRQLVDFSSRSTQGAKIVFLSSIGAVMASQAPNVAEDIGEGWESAGVMGYAQSKLISERIMDSASRIADIPSIVCRVGQIAGPTTAAGSWPSQEWLPSLIRSSKYLGVVPENIGPMETVDWVPVDLMAATIIDLIEANDSTGWSAGQTKVYHAINPHRVSWEDLRPTVEAQLNIKPIPFKEWVQKLAASEGQGESEKQKEELERNPALKLLDFFTGIAAASEVVMQRPNLETKKTELASATIKQMQPVGKEWMESWMKQWGLVY